jgi:NTE family protein
VTIRELKVRHVQKIKQETVLVMQGGGSLGAYECGVYKGLAQQGIKFDIVAGTSIGAINAAIIVGSNSGDSAVDLENFWLELAETVTPSSLPDSLRIVASSWYATFFGVPKAFAPVWFSHKYYYHNIWQSRDDLFVPSSYPFTCNYLYDVLPLKKTLQKYIDYSKLNDRNSNNIPRLIMTCTDIKNSEPVSFDSSHENIDADSIAACAALPFYGIKWTEKDGRCLWDGALLSNTPLREVIDASPKTDKRVFIVNLFPHVQEDFPHNMQEVWHRARDIMYTDKTDNNLKMSRVISKYLLLLKEMHDIISNATLDDELQRRFSKIEPEYHKLAEYRGAIINEIIKIERSEDVHYILEDCDFSLATIKKLIKQGEQDAENALAKNRASKNATSTM